MAHRKTERDILSLLAVIFTVTGGISIPLMFIDFVWGSIIGGGSILAIIFLSHFKTT